MFKVVDNFLDTVYFNKLLTLITDEENTGNNKMPWFFQSGFRGSIEDYGYLYHTFYSIVHEYLRNNRLRPVIYHHYS